MWPIVTDTQQWRGRSIDAAYCYRHTAVAWSVHPCGLLLQTHSSGLVSPYMRPIATDTQQWCGRSIHAAYCYRHTAVAWSVHPCGLLLQTHSSGVVGASMRPIATDAQQWRGRSIHVAYFYWGCGRTTGWPMDRLCNAFLVSTRHTTGVNSNLMSNEDPTCFQTSFHLNDTSIFQLQHITVIQLTGHYTRFSSNKMQHCNRSISQKY